MTSRVIVMVVFVGLLTFFVGGVLTAPARDAEHPDAGIVRAAAQGYLGAEQVRVLQYIGRGNGNDGAWWARVKIEGSPNLSAPARLQAFARKDGWTYSDDADRALAGLDGTRPSWWTAQKGLYSARLNGDSGGFFAAPTEAAEVWNVMEYSR